MLIPSPRHTAADLAAWERLEHYDAMLARDPRLAAAEGRARQAIGEFAAAGPCYASVSWGKDSTVVAWLAVTSAAGIPLAWARSDTDPPETLAVRDAFLAMFPEARYEERRFTWRVPLRGEPGYGDGRPGQDALGEEMTGLPGRYASGVRKAESGRRELAMAVHGTSTARTCRPIGWWSTQQVFSLLHLRGLPVHPSYAMLLGGTVDRERIRVHAVGTGGHRDPFEGDRWEGRYYGDVLEARRERLGPGRPPPGRPEGCSL